MEIVCSENSNFSFSLEMKESPKKRQHLKSFFDIFHVFCGLKLHGNSCSEIYLISLFLAFLEMQKNLKMQNNYNF